MMKICVLSGNPKKSGLCSAVIDAAKQGAVKAGARVDEIRVCEFPIGICRVCGEGWGNCRETGRCEYDSDGFNEIQKRLEDCDAVILATPVYWGEMSEGLKSVLDRLRRCEYGGGRAMRYKQVLLIASAGGGGNGIISCLEQMDRFCRHVNAAVFDYIGVNRWNGDYKKTAAEQAAFAIASGRKRGESSLTTV